MKPTARDFKDHLKEVLIANSKPSWEKDELILYIEETYSDLIECYMEA